MPLPSFLQIFSGGGTPSQPERAEDDGESSQDTGSLL
jgi:hypothetical protein